MIGLKKNMFLMLVVTLTSCTQLANGGEQEFWSVSLIQLIATPDRYRDKTVQIEGFFVYERSGASDLGYLYLNETDYKHEITENAVAVTLSGEWMELGDQLDGKYVLLRGTLDAKWRGPWSLYAGIIKDVTRFEMLDSIN